MNTKDLLNDREQTHGPREECLTMIGSINYGLDRYRRTSPNRMPKGASACLHMMVLKLVRMTWNPQHQDNIDDLRGYLDIFEQIVNKEEI